MCVLYCSRAPAPLAERCIEGIPQRYITKWFEKAVRRALLDEAPPDRLVSMRGDVDNRNLLPAKRQFSLKIWPLGWTRRHQRLTRVTV